MIGRKSFVTWRKHKLIQKKFNNIHFIKYFRDKSLFNIIFCDFLGRQSFKLSDISCEDFGKLVLQNKELFIKDVNGYCGHGIAVVKCRDINYVDFYKMFDSKESQNILVETLINQNRVLSSLHPFSINTIRVTTIYDQNKDKLYLMNARLRIGNFKNRVDNFHQGGLCATIDLCSGIVDSPAYDKNGNKYLTHPVTGVQIIGLQIPYWNELKDFVEKIVRAVPQVGYVGWDIVIQESGKLSIVEGNDNEDHDIQQIANVGIWRQYKSLLKLIK